MATNAQTDTQTPDMDPSTVPTAAEMQAEQDREEQDFQSFAQMLDGKADAPAWETPPAETDELTESPEPTAAHPDEDATNPLSDSTPESTASTPAPAATAPAVSPDDVWAGLNETQREQLAALQREKARAEHAFESNRHRVSAYHRQLNAVQAELEALKAQAANPQVQTPTGTPAPSQPPEGARTDDVDLQKFAEDFPEVYAATSAMYQRQVDAMKANFDKELAALKQQVGAVSEPIQQLNSERQEQYIASQKAALSAAHPDWVQLQEDTHFWGWLDQQSPGMQALIQSSAAEDTIHLLDMYKKQQAAASAPPPPSETQTPPKQTRPRDPEAAAPPPRSGTPAPSSIPDAGNEDAMFDYWARQADSNQI